MRYYPARDPTNVRVPVLTKWWTLVRETHQTRTGSVFFLITMGIRANFITGMYEVGGRKMRSEGEKRYEREIGKPIKTLTSF